jgi:hypothetical protein
MSAVAAAVLVLLAAFTLSHDIDYTPPPLLSLSHTQHTVAAVIAATEHNELYESCAAAPAQHTAWW